MGLGGLFLALWPLFMLPRRQAGGSQLFWVLEHLLCRRSQESQLITGEGWGIDSFPASGLLEK